MLAVSTGSFRAQFATDVPSEAKLFVQAKAISVGKVDAVGVNSLTKKTATATVAAEAHITNAQSPKGKTTYYKMTVALAVGPWFYAIQHATEGGFLAGSVGHDFLGKVLGAQESHGAPPFYYLVLALVTFWPGSLFLVGDPKQAIYRFRGADIEAYQFCRQLIETQDGGAVLDITANFRSIRIRQR